MTTTKNSQSNLGEILILIAFVLPHLISNNLKNSHTTSIKSCDDAGFLTVPEANQINYMYVGFGTFQKVSRVPQKSLHAASRQEAPLKSQRILRERKDVNGEFLTNLYVVQK